MRRLIILLTAVVFVIGASLNAQPNQANKMGMKQSACFNKNDMAEFVKGSDTRCERIKNRLKLTDEQVSKISDFRFKHENLVLDTKNEIQKNKLVIKKMMADNKIDKEKLLKLTSENSSFQAKIKLSKTTLWLDIYNLLDDSQKKQWTKTFQKWGEKSGKFDGKGKSGFGDCNNKKHHNSRMK